MNCANALAQAQVRSVSKEQSAKLPNRPSLQLCERVRKCLTLKITISRRKPRRKKHSPKDLPHLLSAGLSKLTRLHSIGNHTVHVELSHPRQRPTLNIASEALLDEIAGDQVLLRHCRWFRRTLRVVRKADLGRRAFAGGTTRGSWNKALQASTPVWEQATNRCVDTLSSPSYSSTIRLFPLKPSALAERSGGNDDRHERNVSISNRPSTIGRFDECTSVVSVSPCPISVRHLPASSPSQGTRTHTVTSAKDEHSWRRGEAIDKTT